MLPRTIKFLWFKLASTAQSFYFSFTKFCFRKIPPGELLFNMKSKSTKRIENKRKKMAALLEISKLNEYDRTFKKKQLNEDLNTNNNGVESEPSPKRPRTECKEELPIEEPELCPSGKPKLTGLEYQELKKMLREKTNKIRQQPNFRLRDMGNNASISTKIENRVPLFLSDIQHLIMYSQLGHHSSYSPARWCALEKFNKLASTCVLILENISLNDYLLHEETYQFLTSTLTHKLELLAPSAYKGDIVKDISMVPLTGTQMKKFINEFGTLESAVLQSNELFDSVRNLFPIENDDPPNISENFPSSDSYPRTQLLLSGWQMVEENYPLPIEGLIERKYTGYMLTKDKYEAVTPFSPMFGIDCEMCKTTSGDLELTRVSIVDEDLNIFYDTLVKPDNKIIDYLTRFSGITHKMMKNIETKLEDVQSDLRRLLPPDAILVGQSLSNDLHALKMMHPYVIDTSVIFNITGDRTRKTKLKTLSQEFLSEKIQEGKSGHCSTEDSIASLKLTQLKLKKTLHFGDAVMGNVYNEVRSYPELGTLNYATSLLNQTTKIDKTASIIGLNDITARYQFYINKGMENVKNEKIKCYSEKNCASVIERIGNCVNKASLTIGHIKLSDQQVEGSKIHKNIDKWSKNLYEKLPTPGLVIIVLTGTNGNSGVCFIQCKRNI